MPSLRSARKHFADAFAGASLTATGQWQPFLTVRRRSWYSGKTVALGRAAYTSHFSVGLDIRSGLEDAEALAELLGMHSSVEEALKAFDAARRPKAESLQRASTASQQWFEHADLHIKMPFEQFVFSQLTASMRITYARIDKAAPELVRSVDAIVAPQADGSSNRPPPPMFAPITLRGVTIPNRVVVSPMCMYSAKDGIVNDWHVVHLGSRAVGGAGLVITEMTDVMAEGRISLHCAGMYAPELSAPGVASPISSMGTVPPRSRCSLLCRPQGIADALLGRPQEPRRGGELGNPRALGHPVHGGAADAARHEPRRYLDTVRDAFDESCRTPPAST